MKIEKEDKGIGTKIVEGVIDGAKFVGGKMVSLAENIVGQKLGVEIKES